MAQAQSQQGMSQEELQKLPDVSLSQPGKGVTGKKDGEIKLFRNGDMPCKKKFSLNIVILIYFAI